MLALNRLIIVAFLLPTLTFSQKESFNWYFGIKAGITFNPSGNPTALTNSAMSSGKGCATISDSCTGQLYFYTNGDSIINANHQTMLNGTNLDGSSGSTQSAIIVPSPDVKSGEYYVFTVERNNGLKYSVVDMSLAGGLGGVILTKKNLPLISPTVEKVTAVRHLNNKYVWIITHKLNSDEFYAFLLTDTGLVNTPIISSIGQIYGSASQLGYMKASPRGDKLAIALSGDKRFDLCDFDNSNGILSNIKSSGNHYNFAYGVEFSSDGTKLYVTSNLGLFQYNLSSALPGKPLGDSVFLGISPTVAIQIGPDGIIYCNEGYFLGSINEPNNAGLLCNYTPKTINLMSRFSSSGLPTFIQSYFSSIYIVETGICFGLPTLFNLSTDRIIDSVKWDFGEPSSGLANTSYTKSPSHLYNDTGTYLVTTYIYSKKCGFTNTDTVNKKIKIIDLPIPKVDLGKDTVICPTDTVILFTDGNEPSYIWNTGSKLSQIKVNEEGKYWVKATNQCGSLVDTIKIKHFVSSLFADLGKDTTICNGSFYRLNVQQNGAKYLWNTGSSNSEILVKDPGEYWVIINDLCYNLSDTISIGLKERPKIELGGDTVICNGISLILNASYPNSSVIWNDFSTNPTLEVTEEGSYRVSVINDCGSASDDIYVQTKDCKCYVYLPNTFTPNSDGLNDVLELSYSCDFKEYKLEIYTRWDERIFSSTNPNKNWDGLLNGEWAPSGVYSYLLTYLSSDPRDNEEHQIRGIITVLK